MIRLSLPYPPSVNSIWRSVGCRNIKSKQYRQWTILAQQMIAQARITARFDGPYKMEIQVTRPDRRKRDLSNLIKVIEDAMVQSGIIADDCNAQSLTIQWTQREPVKGGAVHVWVWDEQ